MIVENLRNAIMCCQTICDWCQRNPTGDCWGVLTFCILSLNQNACPFTDSNKASVCMTFEEKHPGPGNDYIYKHKIKKFLWWNFSLDPLAQTCCREKKKFWKSCSQSGAPARVKDKSSIHCLLNLSIIFFASQYKRRDRNKLACSESNHVPSSRSK